MPPEHRVPSPLRREEGSGARPQLFPDPQGLPPRLTRSAPPLLRHWFPAEWVHDAAELTSCYCPHGGTRIWRLSRQFLWAGQGVTDTGINSECTTAQHCQLTGLPSPRPRETFHQTHKHFLSTCRKMSRTQRIGPKRSAWLGAKAVQPEHRFVLSVESNLLIRLTSNSVLSLEIRTAPDWLLGLTRRFSKLSRPLFRVRKSPENFKKKELGR